MENPKQIAVALRQIARSLEALADALDGERPSASEDKYLLVLHEWGQRGLTRQEASALFKRHGFAPQAAGAWARDQWIEVREDGRRYLTERSHIWVAKKTEDRE
jgi:hypothetical protein